MPEIIMNVHDIFKLYEHELQLVEVELTNVFKSDALAIPLVGRHVLGSGGKRLRPMYLLLSSSLSGYHGYKRVIFSSIIEAIHTASLLHDDVVDEADVRRGRPTSHSMWGNQVVILVGDFLYANALMFAVSSGSMDIMAALSQAVARMTEGEILQLQKIANPLVTEEEYLKIVSAKTGALISAACRIGALLGGLESIQVEALTTFGLKTGIVFQMYDDILDYEADEDVLGKHQGKDLLEGKITLPLIYLLQSTGGQERDRVIEIIKSSGDDRPQDDTSSDLKEIIRLLRKYSIIEKTIDKANHIMREAREELSSFGDSPERDALFAMADYALQRKK